MTEQTSPSVPEKIATHKPNIQKWIVGVGGGVFLILFIMLVGTIWSNVDKQKKPVTTPPVADKEGEQREATPATERFFSQVDNRVKANDYRKEREAAAQGATAQEPPPVDPNANPGLQRLKAARARLQGQADAESAGAKGGQVSPEQAFNQEERLRALKSRQSRSELVLNTQAPSTAGNRVGGVPGSLTEPLKAQPTLEERKAEVRQKLDDVRKYRESIENGTYNPGQSAGEGRAEPINVRQALAQRTAAPTSQTPATPPMQKMATDVVGMTRANMEAENRNTEGLTLLPTGTVLNGVLSMTTMSDYLGTIKGLITQDVYDVNYETILIPKGSQILIKSVNASNVNLPINARLGLTVPWIILPDGKRIDFSRAAALDHMGIAAIKDQVNYHFMAQFLGVAAYAILASETESDQSSQFTGRTNIEGDINSSLRKQFAPLAARYLNLVPTITLRSGTPFKIIIEDDIYLKPWGTVYDKLYTNH